MLTLGTLLMDHIGRRTVIIAMCTALLLGIGCGPTSHTGSEIRSQEGGGPNSGKEAFTQTGVASWYGPGFHGQQTACGETYDMYALTAAHKQLPFQSRVRVTNLDNGKQVVVRINDRGPFRKQRILDLSLAAAQELDLVDPGTARVRIEKVGNSPDKSYRLQLGSFRRKENASQSRQRAKELGLSHVRVSEVEISGRRYYRVQAGKFSTRSKAGSARDRVSSHFPDSFILVD